MTELSRTIAMIVALAIGACGKQGSSGSAAGSGSAPPPPPPTCPAGSAIGADNTCVAVMTPAKIAAVAQQQSRIDDLAKLLDKVDAVSGPIELLDGFRQLPEWKSLAAKSTKLQIVDQVVGTLDDAVKQLRTFKGQLGEASARLGNLKGELDKLMTETGAAKRLDELRAQVSAEVRSILVPLAAETKDTITRALTPLAAQLSDTADLVIGACAMAKLSGGGDQLKQLCARAKDVFATATAYVDDFKARPVKLYDELSRELEAQLDQLVDVETKKLLDTFQTTVDSALQLPQGSGAPAGSGSGSGSGS